MQMSHLEAKTEGTEDSEEYACTRFYATILVPTLPKRFL